MISIMEDQSRRMAYHKGADVWGIQVDCEARKSLERGGCNGGRILLHNSETVKSLERRCGEYKHIV